MRTTIRTWRGVEGRPGADIYADVGAVSAQPLADGQTIVVANIEGVDVIDRTGLLRRVVAKRGTLTGAVLSVDQTLCACSGFDRTVLVWETATWNLVAQRQLDVAATCLGFTADGKCIVIARGSPEVDVVLIDAMTLEHVSTLLPEREYILGGTGYYAPKNLLAAHYSDHGEAIQLLDVVSKKTTVLPQLPSAPLGQMALAGGNTLIVVCVDGGVRVVSCDSGETIATVTPSGRPTIAAGRSEKLFVTGEGGVVGRPSKVVLRSCKTGKPCQELNLPEAVGRVWFDSEHRTVLAAYSGSELLRWQLPETTSCGRR